MPFLATINRNNIVARIAVRKLTEAGVQRLMDSIKAKGYSERYPIALSSNNSGESYKLLDGNHRLEAMTRLELDRIPAQIFEDLTPEEEWRIAFESNENLNVTVPQDWTDHAEFIWRLAEIGKKQGEIAEILGWSRESIKNYIALNKIAPEAWTIIVGTTKQEFVPIEGEEAVPPIGTTVPKPFTENLLRAIVNLTAEQQLELVKSLVSKKAQEDVNKAKTEFKAKAERYRARNELLVETERQLKDLSETYLERAKTEIVKGVYDKEWLVNKSPGEGFYKLIQSLRDEHARKQNYRLICADIADLDEEQIASESIDVVITDPPYGKEYLPLYEMLAKLASRVLKPGGLLLVMTGQSYIPEIIDLVTPHITYYWTIAYLTPGQAPPLWNRSVNTNWKPVFWFVKDEYTGRCVGDVAKSAGNDKRFHQWGQSESGMAEIVERFTQPGDVILDPFVGGGTTGVVAVALRRKFIGADIKQKNIDGTRLRLEQLYEEQE